MQRNLVMSQQNGFQVIQQALAKPPTYPFNAILLATDVDEVLSSTKNFVSDLNSLSGKICRIFYFKDPQTMQMQQVIAVSQPSGTAYDLAEAMNIMPNKMPCLVVFENLQDDLSNLAIVGLPQADKDQDAQITARLRNVQSYMIQCANNPNGKRVPCFKKKVTEALIVSTAKGALSEVLKDVLSSGISAAVKTIP